MGNSGREEGGGGGGGGGGGDQIPQNQSLSNMKAPPLLALLLANSNFFGRFQFFAVRLLQYFILADDQPY